MKLGCVSSYVFTRSESQPSAATVSLPTDSGAPDVCGAGADVASSPAAGASVAAAAAVGAAVGAAAGHDHARQQKDEQERQMKLHH